MKAKLFMLGILLLAGFSAYTQEKMDNKVIVMLESESRFGFTETVEKISAAAVDSGWKITTIHDLQETMKKNSREVLPVKVIELCNPAHAFNILSEDAYRNVSPMLPCRISVYTKADGKTYLSRMNAPAFAAMIGGKAAETMIRAYDETEIIIRPLVKE